jgi:hypothetical protein
MCASEARIIRLRDPQEAIDVIRGAGRRIVTFSGFSGAGYEDPDTLKELMVSIVDKLDRSVIICSGATAEGIGAIYPIARARDFDTIGIVSSQAEKQKARLADDLDTIYMIEDESWGGCRDDGALSPTSAVTLGASDEIVAIGGDNIARDEIDAALKAGMPVRYFAADMNHMTAIEKAKKLGKPPPINFGGSVDELFRRFSP